MPDLTPNIGLQKPLESESADISALNENMDKIDSALGDLAAVPTTAKDAAGAITELFTNVSDGKTAVAAAITDKGVPTAADDTFAEMADNIGEIPVGPDTSDATAVAGDILASKTAYGAAGTKLTGTMADHGNMLFTPGPTAQTIPAGKHGGGGQVAAVTVPADKVLAGTTIAGTTGMMPDKTGVTTSYSSLNDSTQGKNAKIVSITDQYPDNSIALTFIPDRGYYDGMASKVRVRLWGVNPRNIAAGDPIGWITDAASPPLIGSLSLGKKSASGTLTTNASGIAQVNGLGFTPGVVFLQGYNFGNAIKMYWNNGNSSVNLLTFFFNDSGVQVSTSYSGAWSMSFGSFSTLLNNGTSWINRNINWVAFEA
ncbi:hypothetical protein ACF3MZ_15190 [Paenibacillaceae bacterium WGS1546]|uniref:hypothetical protein n=1 Tax=Cohnella sp. WGS1546 TaxID=3366810 RepID=UPI00372D0B20